jgi:hypothetical protein
MLAFRRSRPCSRHAAPTIASTLRRSRSRSTLVQLPRSCPPCDVHARDLRCCSSRDRVRLSTFTLAIDAAAAPAIALAFWAVAFAFNAARQTSGDPALIPLLAFGLDREARAPLRDRLSTFTSVFAAGWPRTVSVFRRSRHARLHGARARICLSTPALTSTFGSRRRPFLRTSLGACLRVHVRLPLSEANRSRSPSRARSCSPFGTRPALHRLTVHGLASSCHVSTTLAAILFRSRTAASRRSRQSRSCSSRDDHQRVAVRAPGRTFTSCDAFIQQELHRAFA